MSMRHSDSDGSDVFWPGYVDAVTNLVLNLLFLLTIMTVAVFMFALELGRGSKGGSGNTPVATMKPDGAGLSKVSDPVRENIELRLEIQRLSKLLAERNISSAPPVPVPQAVPQANVVKTVEGTSSPVKPVKTVEKTVTTENEVSVRFKDDAVAFTPAERDRVMENLKPVVAKGKAGISVDVPTGFSEAKRMGFYRAMAVRNLLIEMMLPKENIEVAVVEGKSSANASIVRVRSR